jgi:gluconolactonase
VYYIPPGGKPIKIADGIERPSGVTVSRDEKTLYINNTNGVYLLAFDIQPDGTVRNRRNFGTYEGRSQTPNGIPGIMTGADGLTIDSEGRLYAVTAAGIEIFSPTGTHQGTIRMSCAGMNWWSSEENALYCRPRCHLETSNAFARILRQS